jgi:hypothetical protein
MNAMRYLVPLLCVGLVVASGCNAINEYVLLTGVLGNDTILSAITTGLGNLVSALGDIG